MKALFLTIAITCLFTKAFSQNYQASVRIVENPVTVIEDNIATLDLPVIDSVVNKELSFFSVAFMTQIPYGYYDNDCLESLQSHIDTSATKNAIYLNIDNLKELQSERLLDRCIGVFIMQQYTKFLIKKYRLSLNESETLAFGDYLTGYYLGKRNSFFDENDAAQSSQLAFIIQSSNTEALPFAFSENRLEVIQKGFDDFNTELKHRVNTPLRDVIRQGLGVAATVDEQ
ncbi:MAG: hypothetical protein JKY70_20890 [Mucilaginibacter sp.]|nr:hypothetical protein [Mucilaginibacter sp.]